MKLSTFRLTALILSNLLLTYALDVNLSPKHAIDARTPVLENSGSRGHGSEPEYELPPEPKPPSEQAPENASPAGRPEEGGAATYESIKTAVQKLPKPTWATKTISSVHALKRLVGLRPKFQGDPKRLYAAGQKGEVDTAPTDLTALVKKLRAFPKSENLWFVKGEEYPAYKTDPRTGKEVRAGTFYDPVYYSPDEATQAFIERAAARGESIVAIDHWKRSVLQAFDSSDDPNSSQKPTDIFQSYLQIFYTAQSTIGDAITPVLNNFTSQTNITLIHEMALSIYYDLTGSTTALIGPFNNGMSFLNDTSNSTVMTVESIYSQMWLTSSAAANATGVYQQFLDIASCLVTNDTSVYPAGFTNKKQRLKAGN